MKKLELQHFGVLELDAKEMEEIDGGLLPGWLKKLSGAGVALWALENWSDINKSCSCLGRLR